MDKKDLYFDLPDELIAQYPSVDKKNDRLLCINRNTGEYEDKMFSDLPSLLPGDSILVLNDSKVRKARVFAKNDNGGKVELLFLSVNPDGSWNCMCNRHKKRKVGEKLYVDNYNSKCNLEDNKHSTILIDFVIKKINDDGTIIVLPGAEIDEQFFDKIGHVPLPPYIKREDEFSDQSRYQTIYAAHLGSVASPTSGLHYTDKILSQIKERGVEIVKLTLHVGMGTFLPLREDIVEKHKMHKEEFEITNECAEKINTYLSNKRPIVASGTTVVRTLESNFVNGQLKSGRGSTDIFITPGFKFNIVDKLITNFHTPESTLLALVSAFSSLDIVKNAYSHAIKNKYRFFSYGDCTYFY